MFTQHNHFSVSSHWLLLEVVNYTAEVKWNEERIDGEVIGRERNKNVGTKKTQQCEMNTWRKSRREWHNKVINKK
jgi:hypothetical protein